MFHEKDFLEQNEHFIYSESHVSKSLHFTKNYLSNTKMYL